MFETGLLGRVGGRVRTWWRAHVLSGSREWSTDERAALEDFLNDETPWHSECPECGEEWALKDVRSQPWYKKKHKYECRNCGHTIGKKSVGGVESVSMYYR